jgi:hypothetical protein
MAKKKPEIVASISIGNYFNRQEVEIWNDTRCVESSNPNHIMIKRDNGETINITYSDRERISVIKAIASAVIAGRNYGV